MGALLVGKFEEDLFALGVFEALAVALEELVRPALALDADEQRLLIVDALAQLGGAFREQAVGRSLEKQKGRARFKFGIGRDQFLVAAFERSKMFLLFGRETLEHGPAPRILGQAGCARVELETTLFRRNRDPQRVARKDALGGRT